MRIYMRAHAAKELDLLDLDLDLLDLDLKKPIFKSNTTVWCAQKLFFDLRFANFFFSLKERVQGGTS